MDELTKEFLAESKESVDRMERCLTELEQRPDDAELLNEIFRAVHTMKGSTGFLGFGRLEKLSHAGEHLMVLLRDGRVRVSARVVDGLLRLTDGLCEVLSLIEATGGEGQRSDDEDSELITLMESLRTETAPLAVIAASTSARVAPADPADGTVRLDVDVLNRMMGLVGELVQTRNQILQAGTDAERFGRMGQRLDNVTAELRETVMRARLQPVGQLFGKFPRMVRSLAQTCGRRVRLECSGHETALDRSLLESLKDPLIHAVRNSIDHGIEPPEQRLAAGKPAEGTLRLRASHENGHVVIEVEDDGAGMDPERIRSRAIARGVITAQGAATMTERELLQLVFVPGFSTRDEVSMVSGRGIGMDVVRANVEAVGGTADLESTRGCGTTIRLRVPLTLAIMKALVVRSGGLTFALPQAALQELAIVHKESEHEHVTVLGSRRYLRLRGQVLPLVRLADLLELEYNEPRGYYVAILEANGQLFGLAVDDLSDPQEIVIRAVNRMLRGMHVYAGASLLSNGQLALVLDVKGLAALANVRAPEQSGLDEPVVEEPVDLQRQVLLVETMGGEQAAVPIEQVRRIAAVAACDIERVRGRWMMEEEGEALAVRGAEQISDFGPNSVQTIVMLRDHDGGHVAWLVRRVVDITTWTADGADYHGGPHVRRLGARLTMMPGDASAWQEAA